MFKSRKNIKINRLKKPQYGNLGLYNLNQLRYELVYLRFLKKIFRQKHIRRKLRFKKAKF